LGIPAVTVLGVQFGRLMAGTIMQARSWEARVVDIRASLGYPEVGIDQEATRP
jgi:hypothetical protein